MNGSADALASKHMFDINNKPNVVDTGRSVMFHIMTAKLLFLAKRR